MSPLLSVRLALTAIVLGVVCALACPVFFVLAIWTVGANSGRWAGTGGVAFIAALVLLFFGSLAYSVYRPQVRR